MKVTPAQSGNALMLAEFSAERGKVTPLHLHPNEDEGFYVLEGELLVHVDGEETRLAAGGVFQAPRGVPHAFMVTSESARLLTWQTPGTGWDFYEQLLDPISSPDDASRPPDWARLREVAQRSPSIEILGPAPFAAAEAAS